MANRFIHHQKQRIIAGEFETSDSLEDLIPAPWYLAQYRIQTMNRKLQGTSEEDELAERFPVLIATVPSYLIEVLGRLRAEEDNEILEKLLIDVLTFFFSPGHCERP